MLMQVKNKMHNNKLNQPQLFEGLEKDDLARLVFPELHIDEFKSKMGDDADIIVLSFLVDGKEPATDLMNFIERGYDWVFDADISSGELDDGQYLVFVELERNPEAAAEVHVEPLDVNTLPLEPGATKVTLDVPLPINTLFAVSVVSPVPPEATGSAVPRVKELK